jgi:hypothetical protein
MPDSPARCPGVLQTTYRLPNQPNAAAQTICLFKDREIQKIKSRVARHAGGLPNPCASCQFDRAGLSRSTPSGRCQKLETRSTKSETNPESEQDKS